MSFKEKLKSISIFADFWYFLKKYKKWWMGPIILFLLLLGFIIFLIEGSALAPFIYTLF